MALVTSRTHRHISDQLLQSDRATRGHGAPAGSPPAPSGRAPKQEAMAEAPSLPIPAQETTRRGFDPWEDPLEEEMATHVSILAWRIPWKRSLAGYGP